VTAVEEVDLRSVAGHRAVYQRETCHEGHPEVLVCAVCDQLWPCRFVARLRDVGPDGEAGRRG